jgi:hypothetical protein
LNLLTWRQQVELSVVRFQSTLLPSGKAEKTDIVALKVLLPFCLSVDYPQK